MKKTYEEPKKNAETVWEAEVGFEGTQACQGPWKSGKLKSEGEALAWLREALKKLPGAFGFAGIDKRVRAGFVPYEHWERTFWSAEEFEEYANEREGQGR